MLWEKYNQHEIKIYVVSDEKAINDIKLNRVAYSGVTRIEEGLDWASYSLPIHNVDIGLVLNRKYKKSTQLNDLNNIKVAVKENSIQSAYLNKNNNSFEIIYYTEPRTVFNKLLLNEIDAIVAEVPFINSQLTKLDLKGVLVVSDEIIMSNQIHAMVSNENQDLLEIINTGILNIPLTELVELEKKWLPNLTPFFIEENKVPFLSHDENTWLNNNNNFSVGIDTSWYPFEFVDNKGKFNGISADYVKYLEDTLGVKLSPEYKRKWVDSYELFKQGKIDVMSGIIATDNRKKIIDFTQAYFKAPTVIVTKKNAFYVGDIMDLNGKKLGLVRGFAIVELIKNDYPDIKIELVNSIVDGLRALENGEIDAYLGTLAVVNYEMDKHEFDDIKIAAFAPYKFEISMAVRKGLEPLVSILNKSFDQMSEKQKTSIANDWLAIHIDTGSNIKTTLKWVLPILSLLILIIIVMTSFNKKLKIQIQQRKKAQQELQHLAGHDSLTGLFNWRNFSNKFNEIIAKEPLCQMVILFLDLDGFKLVNDTFGHDHGDTVLIETAKRLQDCVKNKGILARVGGDEFIVLLSNVQIDKTIDKVCSSIIESIAVPYVVKEQVINIGVSIGVSNNTSDSCELDELVKQADTAMYEAKKLGKNNYKFHQLLPPNS